ncbi:MAG: trypsin-like serine protease [Umezawaea sp.]
MKRLSLLLAVIVLAVTPALSAHAIVRPNSMGPAPGSQIYYTASLQEKNSVGQSPHFCGGVLIAPTWVVTARECTEGRAPETIAVRIGSRSLTSGGELVTVSRVVPHPTDDVALIELSERVAAVPAMIAVEPGSAGTQTMLLGWGQTCPTRGCGGPTPELQVAYSVTEPESACGVGSEQICTKYDGGGGPCFGDEGGPLITNNATDPRLVGLVPSRGRFGDECRQGRSALTDLTAVRDWITQQTGG